MLIFRGLGFPHPFCSAYTHFFRLAKGRAMGGGSVCALSAFRDSWLVDGSDTLAGSQRCGWYVYPLIYKDFRYMSSGLL